MSQAFKHNLPGPQESIFKAEKDNNFVFWKEYKNWLQKSNGGEGFIYNGDYVIIWPVEDIAEYNKEYEVYKYVFDFVFIGSNGGGEAIAVSRQGKEGLFLIPFVGMSDALAMPYSIDLERV